MKKISLLYIILAGMLWGTSCIFVKLLSPFGFSSLQLTFFRCGVSFLIMLLYILIFDKNLIKTTKNELLLFIGSGLALFGTAACYYYSMVLSSVAMAVVLMYTSPLFIMIYSIIFFGERLSKLKSVTVACMLLGCALVSGIVGGIAFNLTGFVFGMLSSFCYSAYNIFTKISMSKRSNPITATMYCFMSGAIAGLLFCRVWELPALLSAKPIATIPLSIGIGVCTCILPYFLYTLSLKDIPASTASSLSVLEPLSATIFGFVFLGQSLTFFSIIGIILILGSVFLLGKYGG